VKLDAHPAPTAGPGDHELEILKAKQEKPAAPADGDGPGEVETLKAKIARNAADATTRDVLKEKRADGVAASTSALPEDEPAILKAKRGHSAASADDVETLKAKLAGNVAATEGKTAPSAPQETWVAPARTRASPSDAGRWAPVRATLATPNRVAASRVAESRRRSAFDLAFVLVLILWGVAIAVALTAGPQWWLFACCLAASVLALLLALYDSAGFREESHDRRR
jgi:hypothetical protein